MKNLLVCITATFWSLASFGQHCDFLPKSYVRLVREVIIQHLNKDPKSDINYFFENGTTNSKSQYISVPKLPRNERLTVHSFADTIQKVVSVVYRKRSVEEQKNQSQFPSITKRH